MAKIDMLCPFSKELCRECPQYRGRHYYLCFYTKYRGYLGNPEEGMKKKSWSRGTGSFQMPIVLPTSPKWLNFSQFVERKQK